MVCQTLLKKVPMIKIVSEQNKPEKYRVNDSLITESAVSITYGVLSVFIYLLIITESKTLFNTPFWSRCNARVTIELSSRFVLGQATGQGQRRLKKLRVVRMRLYAVFSQNGRSLSCLGWILYRLSLAGNCTTLL